MTGDAFIRRHVLFACDPSPQLFFPSGRIAFLRQIRAWHREALSPMSMFDGPACTVILQSWKRTWNMDALVRSYLRLPFVQRIVVSNNNPAIDIHTIVQASDARLELINQPMPRTASMMGVLAMREAARGAELLLCVDDDVFLREAQILTLLQGLKNDSRVPHGVVGQSLDRHTGTFRHHIRGQGKADVINRVYAFNAGHAQRYGELLDRLGYTSEDMKMQLPFGSDIVLSFTGGDFPHIHAVGNILSCPTASVKGIARWKENGFDHFRMDLFRSLSAITGR